MAELIPLIAAGLLLGLHYESIIDHLGFCPCPLLTVNYKTLDCFNKDPRYKQVHFGMTEIECKMMGSDATALPASEWSLVANLG